MPAFFVILMASIVIVAGRSAMTMNGFLSRAIVTYTVETQQSLNSTKLQDLLQKFETKTTTGDVFTLCEEIPAIRRSVDKAMRIVSAKDEDAILASYAIQRLASLNKGQSSGQQSHKIKKRSFIRERSFEQLTECVELRIAKLKTIDLARYLWGLAVLGVGEKKKIDLVLNEYNNRLISFNYDFEANTTSNRTAIIPSSETTLEKMAIMFWTLGCVQDSFSWTNSSLALGLSKALSDASISGKFATLSTRLVVRILWSFAVHKILDQELLINGLSLVISRPVDELSTTNNIILIWSCSHFMVSHANILNVKFNLGTHIAQILDRLSATIKTDPVNIDSLSLAIDGLDTLSSTKFAIEDISVRESLVHCIQLIFYKLPPVFIQISPASLFAVMRLSERLQINIDTFREKMLDLLSVQFFPKLDYDDNTVLYSLANSNHDNIAIKEAELMLLLNQFTMISIDIVTSNNISWHRMLGRLVTRCSLMDTSSNNSLIKCGIETNLNTYNYSVPLPLAMSDNYFDESNTAIRLYEDFRGYNFHEYKSFVRKLALVLNASSIVREFDLDLTARSKLVKVMWEINNVYISTTANVSIVLPLSEEIRINILRSLVSEWSTECTVYVKEIDDEKTVIAHLTTLCDMIHLFINMKWVHDSVYRLCDDILDCVDDRILHSPQSAELVFHLGCFEELISSYKKLQDDLNLIRKGDSTFDKGVKMISNLFGKV